MSFSRKYGQGGFVLYWMENWVTMSALGFVMETVFLWLGPFFPFFLVFWVIINVSARHELTPAFSQRVILSLTPRYPWRS